MTTPKFTKIEKALLLGLLLSQGTHQEAVPLKLTDEDRELAAKLLRNFVGTLTCKLLGNPTNVLALVDDEIEY